MPSAAGASSAHARRGELGLDLVELLAHHLVQARAVRQDFKQFADVLRQTLELVADLVAAERSQAVEPQVEDRADLRFGQPVDLARGLRFDRFDQLDVGRDLVDRPFARQQLLARFGGRRRPADDPHHFVEVGDRDDQAEQDMRALAGLEQLELRAPSDHFLAEADEGLDEVAKRQRLGPAAADRQHVGREARLRRRVPPQLVEHDVGRRIALQVDDDPHAFAVQFVADVGDAFDPLVLGGFGDLLDEAVLADLVRDFGEHDRAAIAAAFLDVVARAQDDRSAARRCRRRECPTGRGSSRRSGNPDPAHAPSALRT